MIYEVGIFFYVVLWRKARLMEIQRRIRNKPHSHHQVPIYPFLPPKASAVGGIRCCRKLSHLCKKTDRLDLKLQTFAWSDNQRPRKTI
jgi:hypothetical protein